MDRTALLIGTVIAIRGAVLDVRFGTASLPHIDEALEIDPDGPDRLVAEVQSHLDDATVRAIALQPVGGIRRGTRVRATGGPVTVPVGEAVLGRVLDVLGGVQDRGPATARRHTALADPPRAAAAERPDRGQHRVRDRHQGHRPADPARPGRQGRHVRRRRRRQDRAADGADPRHGRALPRHLGLRRHRRAARARATSCCPTCASPACWRAPAWCSAR